MLCQWLKCARPAVIDFCGKQVCEEHCRAVDEVGTKEARRILNVDDMTCTVFSYPGCGAIRRARKAFVKGPKKK